jgi:hypothetical protein
MTLKQVKEIAKTKGVKTGSMKKENIIRAIQLAEGNFDCFGSAYAGDCNQAACLWRADCLK